MNKQYYVYIMTNKLNTVLYTGVTNDLLRRVCEHKEKLADGFTKKYKTTKLVYYEIAEDIESAIQREKQIKGYLRQRKIRLIESVNKEWLDLYEKLLEGASKGDFRDSSVALLPQNDRGNDSE